MTKQIETSIRIKASSETVWDILTDFEKYPQWNPFIKSVKGEVKEGNNIEVRIEPPGAKGMTFKPKVLAFKPQKEFKWLGNLWVKGLFDGEHAFFLTAHKDGSTTLVQSEKFKGILVPLFSNMLDNNTLKGFQQMNEKLRELAEAKVLESAFNVVKP
ncbi:hypothetical protein GCM10011506_36990 [Marivirga lumbricoides]|uniref:SRPBCC domain-containing protein n=1 Tax=Marivirga lumbricoides TaxID=1046115 RepID=A0ABQ1MZA3_9BACT|nr:hypothetical protein GCM10011506_36990 [Marivirga lumbricoides]